MLDAAVDATDTAGDGGCVDVRRRRVLSVGCVRSGAVVAKVGESEAGRGDGGARERSGEALTRSHLPRASGCSCLRVAAAASEGPPGHGRAICGASIREIVEITTAAAHETTHLGHIPNHRRLRPFVFEGAPSSLSQAGMRLCQSQRPRRTLQHRLGVNVRHIVAAPIGSADLCRLALEPQLQQRGPAQTSSASPKCLDIALFVARPTCWETPLSRIAVSSPATLPNVPSRHVGLDASNAMLLPRPDVLPGSLCQQPHLARLTFRPLVSSLF
jgi:hypothetical protein